MMLSLGMPRNAHAIDFFDELAYWFPSRLNGLKKLLACTFLSADEGAAAPSQTSQIPDGNALSVTDIHML